MKLQPIKRSNTLCCDGEEEDKERYPSVSLDMPQELLDNISVGMDVVITIKGRVERVSQSDDEYGNYMGIEMFEIDAKADGKNPFADLVEQDED